MQKDWRRDPIWQLIGVIIGVISIFGVILSLSADERTPMIIVSVFGFATCGLLLFKKQSQSTPKSRPLAPSRPMQQHANYDAQPIKLMDKKVRLAWVIWAIFLIPGTLLWLIIVLSSWWDIASSPHILPQWVDIGGIILITCYYITIFARCRPKPERIVKAISKKSVSSVVSTASQTSTNIPRGDERLIPPGGIRGVSIPRRATRNIVMRDNEDW